MRRALRRPGQAVWERGDTVSLHQLLLSSAGSGGWAGDRGRPRRGVVLLDVRLTATSNEAPVQVGFEDRPGS